MTSAEQDVRARVDELLTAIRKADGTRVQKLDGWQRLCKKRNRDAKKDGGFTLTNWHTLVLVLAFVVYHQLYTHQGFTRFLFKIYREEKYIGETPCTVGLPDIAYDLFRPPADCSKCSHVQRIEKVSNITPAEFEEKYAYSAHPVVIVDGMVNWTATKTFSFDFFRSLYGADSPVRANVESDCQFFPYQTDFYNMDDVFEMSEDRKNMKNGEKPWYIGWSNCDAQAANILRQHYNRPYFLPEVSESSKTDWIFMGSPGYGANMHVDNVGRSSWQAQITGKKHWFLQPPFECGSQCRGVDVVVEPGEIIVLDTDYWYHKTLIVSEDPSITIGSEYD